MVQEGTKELTVSVMHAAHSPRLPHAMEAMAAEAQRRLVAAGLMAATVRSAGERLMVVHAGGSAVKVARVLAEMHNVNWVEAKPEMRLMQGFGAVARSHAVQL